MRDCAQRPVGFRRWPGAMKSVPALRMMSATASGGHLIYPPRMICLSSAPAHPSNWAWHASAAGTIEHKRQLFPVAQELVRECQFRWSTGPRPHPTTDEAQVSISVCQPQCIGESAGCRSLIHHTKVETYPKSISRLVLMRVQSRFFPPGTRKEHSATAAR